MNTRIERVYNIPNYAQGIGCNDVALFIELGLFDVDRWDVFHIYSFL